LNETLAIMKIRRLATAVFLVASTGAVFSAPKPLQLDGRFEYRTDAESQSILGNQICFFPSTQSAALLPRAPGDERLAWFCFSDTEQAAKHLNIALQPKPGACGTTGTATVEVEDYRVFVREGEGNDVAALRLVLQQSKSSPLPCKP
jgi:hypothetical protein